MGKIFTKIKKMITGPKRYKVLLLGPEEVGKTTSLYQLKYPAEKILIIPTNGFNLETINYKEVNINLYDITFNTNRSIIYSMSAIAKNFLNQNGIIFMVDSVNLKKDTVLKTTVDMFKIIVEFNDYKSLPIIIIANKQDLPGALGPEEIAVKLDLYKLGDARKWFIRGACGKTGEGLRECLDWMLEKVIIPEQYD